VELEEVWMIRDLSTITSIAATTFSFPLTSIHSTHIRAIANIH